MHVSNIRLGHAANSSSTHTALLLDSSQYDGTNKNAWGDLSIISDPVRKAGILQWAFIEGLTEAVGKSAARLLWDGLQAKNPQWPSAPQEGEYSFFLVPKHLGINNAGICFDFLQEFITYVLQTPEYSFIKYEDSFSLKDVLDNNRLTKIDADIDYVNFLGEQCGGVLSIGPDDGLYARKQGSWWTLYNKYSGAKLRISFEKNPEPYLYSDFPELCDVSITTKCPYGCKNCYMNCGTTGLDADADIVGALRYALTSNTFEIALGGGEPTLHPQFLDILQGFSEGSITPNFTTRNYSVLIDSDYMDIINAQVGVMALSIASHTDLDELEILINKIHHRKVTLGFQVILDATPRSVIERAIAIAEDAVGVMTFLGYKTTGRASSTPPTILYDEELASIIFSNGASLINEGRLQFDTAAVQRCEKILNNPVYAGQKRLLKPSISVEEGTFSCYINAATDDSKSVLLSQSSFCKIPRASNITVPLSYSLTQHLREAYIKMQRNAGIRSKSN